MFLLLYPVFYCACVCNKMAHYCLPTDIIDNKEFYLSTEVRPPFTYASLIRQVTSTLLILHSYKKYR